MTAIITYNPKTVPVCTLVLLEACTKLKCAVKVVTKDSVDTGRISEFCICWRFGNAVFGGLYVYHVCSLHCFDVSLCVLFQQFQSRSDAMPWPEMPSSHDIWPDLLIRHHPRKGGMEEKMHSCNLKSMFSWKWYTFALRIADMASCVLFAHSHLDLFCFFFFALFFLTGHSQSQRQTNSGW